ncbi:MAG: hypothetical protein ACRYGF_00345 [Janthinobacterium lividum]
MPLLKISESKKLTATISLEEVTARRIEQYAAMTKGTPDEVIQQALDYIFSKDKDFERFCTEQPNAKPKIALRIKRPPAPADATATAKDSTSAAR